MDNAVYLGAWTNWSRGPLLGATLTTTRATGNLIIAFTAFFIAFVATRFWRIFCLAAHKYLSTPDPRDTIHHQRQVILRNSSTPESGLLSFLQLLWAWRKLPIKRNTYLLPFVLVATGSLAAFTVAGGFSSRISTAAGDEVLIQGSSCGFYGGLGTLAQSLAAQRLNDATNYAQQCYDNSTGMLECNKFVLNRLPTTTADTEASCPFQDQICRAESNILLDTGFVNSHDHLGLNTPEHERIAWRHVLHCAPLKTIGYTSHVVGSNKGSIRFHYGNRLVGVSNDVMNINYTCSVDDVDSQYSNYTLDGKEFEELGGNNFRLVSLTSATFQGAPLIGDLILIPELQRTDADVIIVFLSGNGVRFGQLMDDEWYRATTPNGHIVVNTFNESTQAYRPDEAASPMGCAEQWQLCNMAYPGNSGCGPLASQLDAIYGAAPLFNLTGPDLEYERPSLNTTAGTLHIWNSLTLSVSPTNLEHVMRHLGAKALASQARLYDGVQWPLPNNQWQLDVIRWWETKLALIQAAYVETALGTNDPELEKEWWPPLNEEEQKLCNSQKIRSTSYSSFSLFGLCFTFIMGALITGISYIIEPIQAFLSKRRKLGQYAHLEWVTTTSLQLHRLVHEELGLKEWSNFIEAVPTTASNATLASLDISDPDHPCFSRPDTKENTGSLAHSDHICHEEQSGLDPDHSYSIDEAPHTSTQIESEHTEQDPSYIGDDTSTHTGPQCTEVDPLHAGDEASRHFYPHREEDAKANPSHIGDEAPYAFYSDQARTY